MRGKEGGEGRGIWHWSLLQPASTLRILNATGGEGEGGMQLSSVPAGRNPKLNLNLRACSAA